MEKKVNPIRETTDDARLLARTLIRTARFGSLAVNTPKDGFPSASRTLVSTDSDGAPIILISDLTSHTKSIMQDNRISILLGEPGKGDPLAHPRITLQCESALIGRDSLQYKNLRARFITRHPKSELYIDFGDFNLFRLEPKSASLNGGFGKAFALTPHDFLITSKINDSLSEIEPQKLIALNEQPADVIAQYLTNSSNLDTKGWRIISIDCQGIELAKGEIIIRREFYSQLQALSELEEALNELRKN
jgi:putative heme iron utilization protein